jgi:succinyl-CoA:acetate CoA-transferase
MKIPKRIANTVINSLKGGVVPRVGLPYIAVGRKNEINALLHDVDIIVTEQGYADLRFKSPRQRAEAIIENCAHPDYRPLLREYYEHALAVSPGMHTPHDLAEAFSWHLRYEKTGKMKG